MAVVCGGGGGGGGGGERQRGAAACDKGRGGGVQRQRAAAACGGGVRLFSVTRDGTLRREMKIYVKDMSGHKFGERGGDVHQICVFMTDIHIIGIKIGLKRHKFVSL